MVVTSAPGKNSTPNPARAKLQGTVLSTYQNSVSFVSDFKIAVVFYPILNNNSWICCTLV